MNKYYVRLLHKKGFIERIIHAENEYAAIGKGWMLIDKLSIKTNLILDDVSVERIGKEDVGYYEWYDLI